MKTWKLLLVSWTLAACERPTATPPTNAEAAAQVFGGGVEWVDLTHEFGPTTIYWPTASGFRLERVFAGRTPAGHWYEANNFQAAEHGGTHLDAPVHFAEGRRTTDSVPLSSLIGPAAVVDVRDSAAANADYLVSVADLTRWERAHGRLPDGAVVLLRTGWDTRWPDRARYLGTADTGVAATTRLHFPGLDPSAARFLVSQRRVAAVGLDTPSLDAGPSATYESHVVLMGENVPGFENLTGLDHLPETGAYVVALPMKIAGGSGGPLRIVAAIPR
jgi:kynurenine formamidase